LKITIKQTGALLLSLYLTAMQAVAEPVVFKGMDAVMPGQAVMLYGGDLGSVKEVQVASLDGGAKTTVQVLQPREQSIKFILPKQLESGIFSVDYGGKTPWLLNRPDVWFVQPTTLRPGLLANQIPPETEIQIVGKHLAFTNTVSTQPRVMLHSKKGQTSITLALVKAEPYSLLAKLPSTVTAGLYTLLVSNGAGNEKGLSLPFEVEVKNPDVWPNTIFNVKDFGAKGDDMADDTQAITSALAAAATNNGGVVYLPWGTYRMSNWIYLPERTTLRGEGRDATLLKWPVDEPTNLTNFVSAAVYASARYAVEDLTFVARKANTIFIDMSVDLNNPRTVPEELLSKVKPWGDGRDKFLRRVRFQHWLLVGHPERTIGTDLAKRHSEPLQNFIAHDLRNFEVSDCEFQGGNQQFVNVQNGRVVRSVFSNQLGPCWSCLGGGAIDMVCEGNELRCSSSFGWGWLGLNKVYSAHNKSYNFERGEREAMTLDISAFPTARPVSQHWGECAEIGERDGKGFLRFNNVKWVPDIFKDGQALSRGNNQKRVITGNNKDTVFLDKPFPKTKFDLKLPFEIQPRHWRAQGGTTAWLGKLKTVTAMALTADKAKWIPQEFIGMTVLILSGKGTGQYRVITDNSADVVTFDRPWDIPPDTTSVIGIWSLMRHMIVYKCEAEDTSSFAQLYGSFYDYTVDACKVERTQGLWGQMGWFVQFMNNHIRYGNSYHPGIGMPGGNPEKRAPYGYTGLVSWRLRVTKSGALQYPDLALPLFVDDVLGFSIPSTLCFSMIRNTLSYNQRLAVEPWSGDKVPGPCKGGIAFTDIVIDGNHVEHSKVGIQIGASVDGVVLRGNTFKDVDKPVWGARPNALLWID
jgi:hypothetical protein